MGPLRARVNLLLVSRTRANNGLHACLRAEAAGSAADVLAVFGVWAVLSGAAQFAVATRRRRALGHQWPMRLAR
jgi:hypothetical protein